MQASCRELCHVMTWVWTCSQWYHVPWTLMRWRETNPTYTTTKRHAMTQDDEFCVSMHLSHHGFMSSQRLRKGASYTVYICLHNSIYIHHIVSTLFCVWRLHLKIDLFEQSFRSAFTNVYNTIISFSPPTPAWISVGHWLTVCPVTCVYMASTQSHMSCTLRPPCSTHPSLHCKPCGADFYLCYSSGWNMSWPLFGPWHRAACHHVARLLWDCQVTCNCVGL